MDPRPTSPTIRTQPLPLIHVKILIAQNSPSPPPPTTAAVQRPIKPHQLTFHPLQSPSTPCPRRYTASATPGLPFLGTLRSLPTAVAAGAVGTALDPSSFTIVYMVPNMPSYLPGCTIVSIEVAVAPPSPIGLPRGLAAGSTARTYCGWLSTATWPRRRTVSNGSLRNRATVEDENLASEKVVGDISLSILNLVLRTSGVERARTGWTRECRTVGRTRLDGHRYEGRPRSSASVLRGPRVVDVIIDLILSAAVRLRNARWKAGLTSSGQDPAGREQGSSQQQPRRLYRVKPMDKVRQGRPGGPDQSSGPGPAHRRVHSVGFLTNFPGEIVVPCKQRLHSCPSRFPKRLLFATVATRPP